MNDREKAQFGMIGMAVMGRNLAMNIADHGYSVAVWNREPELTESAVAESGGKLRPTPAPSHINRSNERVRIPDPLFRDLALLISNWATSAFFL